MVLRPGQVWELNSEGLGLQVHRSIFLTALGTQGTPSYQDLSTLPCSTYVCSLLSSQAPSVSSYYLGLSRGPP